MAGAAYEVMKKFWEMQDGGDYGQLLDLFAEEAIFFDLGFGTFKGKKAIGEFLAQVTEEAKKSGVSFELLELQGDENVAWAKWSGKTPAGEKAGCGIYLIKKGKIQSYADYYNVSDFLPSEEV